MKKITVILILAIALFSCTSQYKVLTRKQIGVSPGMKKDEIINIMGVPENKQFRDKYEAWQYCATRSSGSHYFLVVWFYDGVAYSTTTYNNKGIYICTNYFNTIQWEEAPDRTIEIRDR